MIKKTFWFFWNARREVVKYIIVGGSGVILDIGTLVLFKRMFHVNATVAVALNQILLLAFNFSLNKYWSFRNRVLSHRQVVRYLTLAGINYVISVATMHEFATIMHFDEKLVRLCTIALATSWNFVLYKLWVYKSETSAVHNSEQVVHVTD